MAPIRWYMRDHAQIYVESGGSRPPDVSQCSSGVVFDRRLCRLSSTRSASIDARTANTIDTIPDIRLNVFSEDSAALGLDTMISTVGRAGESAVVTVLVRNIVVAVEFPEGYEVEGEVPAKSPLTNTTSTAAYLGGYKLGYTCPMV